MGVALEGVQGGSVHRRRIRIEQSREELERLRREFGAWLEHRRIVDRRQQYASQLDSLELAITASVVQIEAALDDAPERGPTRQVHESCRRIDGQTVFVRRLWGYFRDKWAQRDDAELGPALAAADEVVWSCWAPPFRLHRDALAPAPLPFFDDRYSPYAIPRSHPPEPLSPSDELLRRTLEGPLPMPMIGIPPICAPRPWWLVLVAHEVGHQVPYAFGGRPVDALRSAVTAAADSVGGVTSGLWGDWADELFADTYAAALVGGAHHWGLVELEQGSDATLVRFSEKYPPPIVRHALTAAVLAELGLAATDSLPPVIAAAELDELEIESDKREWVAELLAAVPTVAAALARTPLIGKTTIAQATGCDPKRLSDTGDVGWWARRLIKSASIPPHETLEAPRYATVGALTAWTRIAGEEDERLRATRTEELRQRTLAVVPECHEVAKRAASAPAEDAGTFADRLARDVLALPADEPEPLDPAATPTARLGG